MVIQGVIRPPPEIRAVADRTALYVAKNGRAFESRILGSAKGRTPKFAFLHETSPFHAYYEDRIQFYENGGEDEPSLLTRE
jgi:splicing factor 3A subunit 1